MFTDCPLCHLLHPCVGRSLVPFYDVRFKGFGYNKQLQILQLVKQRRFRLMVRQ